MIEPLGGEPIGVQQNRRSYLKVIFILVLAVGLPVVFIVGILVVTVGGIYFSVTSVEEYKCAMTEIRKNRQAIELLGEPMREGYFILPNIEISGSRRDVNFQVSMTGPKSSATLTVSSYRNNFQSNFQMYLEKDGSEIKLYNGVYPCR